MDNPDPNLINPAHTVLVFDSKCGCFRFQNKEELPPAQPLSMSASVDTRPGHCALVTALNRS